jgi:hypothetical protein
MVDGVDEWVVLVTKVSKLDFVSASHDTIWGKPPPLNAVLFDGNADELFNCSGRGKLA